MSIDNPLKIAVVARHPIQYQAGLWREMNDRSELSAKVIFLDTIGIDGTRDPTLNAQMLWDMPLLEGYEHSFVKNISPFRFAPVLDRVNPGLIWQVDWKSLDFVIVHGYQSVSNWLVLALAKIFSVKVIYRGEGSLKGKVERVIPGIVNRIFLRRCDVIAYSSVDNREYLKSRGGMENKFVSMPCAVDNKQLEVMLQKADPQRFVKEHNLSSKGQIILTVNRLTENKRTEDCIRSMIKVTSELPDAQLIIAGDGPQMDYLQALVKEHRLQESVRFLGFLNQSQIIEAALLAELFVIGSSHNDPSPKALSEMLFQGLPVVCSSGVGTSEELVQEGKNGYIVPPRCPDQMADRMLSVLKSEELRLSMGVESKKLAEVYSFATGVDNLITKMKSN